MNDMKDIKLYCCNVEWNREIWGLNVMLAFHCYNKGPERISLKEKIFYLGSVVLVHG